ncbi:KAP family P-loop NTPase fold protein [Acidimangrovimonas pyrenivorans]|uniref:P-loop NTPase fold protein n=1 Tax=Acidimangrovimonas pyrenivorans TaxID=2030798 RepID=A0ABV7AKG8_9RHOB
MSKISVADEPIKSVVKDGKVVPRAKLQKKENPDSLETGTYANSLAGFIRRCDTPLTIGIQGEWGSGKTSLLNMIREEIEESEVAQRGTGTLLGKDRYKTIWVNTWEHSLLRSPEECLLSIIEEIIEAVTEVDGSYKTAERAKSALAGLAQSALKVGAGLAAGAAGAQVAEDLISGRKVNKIKQLRESLADIVESVVNRDTNKVERFVIFVDDLDRLEPAVAVMVLELLKNIFTLEHCVFVLAIDYQVVVKGLKNKFGEQTEDNEWEFRAFFDKIIQLPFMMPMARYKLDNYLTKHLLDIEYFRASERNLYLEDGTLARVVKLTLGYNPRSMKRLINALSLIRLQAELEVGDNDNGGKKDRSTTKISLQTAQLRRLVFALVCFQISFPRIYDLLLREPDFSQWDEEFADRMTADVEDDAKIATALNRAMQFHLAESEEPWAQALFRIVWLKKWDRNRLPEAFSLMSEIKEQILNGTDDETFAEFMITGLKMTAVTAVAASEDGIFAASAEDDKSKEKRDRAQYWERFRKTIAGTGCVFDPQKSGMRATHSSPHLIRKLDTLPTDVLQFTMTNRPSAPLRIESTTSEDGDALQVFQFLQKRRGELEKLQAASCVSSSGRIVPDSRLRSRHKE